MSGYGGYSGTTSSTIPVGGTGAGSGYGGGATGGAPQGGGGGGGGGGPPGDYMDPEKLMITVNIFVFGAIGILALLRLPQLIGLLRSKSWSKGHWLHYATPPPPPVTKAPAFKIDFTHTKEVVTLGEGAKSRPNTLHQHQRESRMTFGRMYGAKTPEFPMSMTQAASPSHPPHVPVVPWFLRPILVLSRVRVFEGYSLVQIVILAAYLYGYLYAVFVMSNPLTDAVRPGWVAVSQMPLLFALAQKSNIMGTIIGYSYEKLNYIHRFAGILVVLGADVHSVYYFYKWTMAGTFKQSIARPSNMWGLIAFLCMNLLLVFSTASWRKRSYTVFIWTHTIGVLLLLPATYLHKRSVFPYIVACIVLYGLDRLTRTFKTRIATAHIISLPQLRLTRLEIPTINAGWRPGQHVRIRILNSGMGWFGWSEIHPFTIASAPDTPDGLVLLCKDVGNWTHNLGLLANEKTFASEGRNAVKVWVEGPFGGPGRMLFESFSAAVFVVGGSGITFGLSMLQDLVAKDAAGACRLRYAELVWVCPEPTGVTPLVPAFTSLIQQSTNILVKVSVFYTKAPTGPLPFATRNEVPTYVPVSIAEGLTLTPGRPKLGVIMEEVVARVSAMGGNLGGVYEPSGLAVGVCGPGGLGNDVVKAVTALDSAKRDQVGGVEIHEEPFGL